MRKTILKGRKIVEGKCKGKALVSKSPISFLGGINPADGRIIDKTNDLYGQTIKNSILCFPNGSGSTVGSYVLYSLAQNKLAPKAILNEKADPVIVVGAIIAKIPMIDRIKIDQIRTGEEIIVNAYDGTIEIIKTASTK